MVVTTEIAERPGISSRALEDFLASPPPIMIQPKYLWCEFGKLHRGKQFRLNHAATTIYTKIEAVLRGAAVMNATFFNEKGELQYAYFNDTESILSV